MSEKEEKKLETMQKQMEETVSNMKQEFDTRMKEMQLKADEVMGKGREAIRERPLTYVGLAFGVGLIIGAILVKALDKD